MENNKEILEKIIREKIITINDLEGNPQKLLPIFFTYKVPDMLGDQALIPAMGFMNIENEQQPYGVLTKCFGEFIGLKNCVYIDTNNIRFANQLLEMGIAKDTGFYKQSGFCKYPLWEFDERFLKELGGKEYIKYSERFDEIMDMYSISNDDEESEDEIEDIEIGMGS